MSADDWNKYFMGKPSDLKDLYPDCFGAIERLERDREARIVRWVSHTLIAFIAVSATMALLYFLEVLK